MKKAFTLLEMLVVMSIIGLLSTVIIPNIAAAQNKAKEAAVRAIVHTVQADLEGYQLEQGSYPTGTYTLAELALLVNGKVSYKNPFTGKTYTAADTSGQITYVEAEGNYTLTAYKRDGSTELLTLANN